MKEIKQKICERIFELKSLFDEPVITEQALADHLGVSRTPVRDVLRDLEQEKLIERKQKKGITVRQPDIKTIIEMYDSRTALEGFAMRLAAEQVSEDDIIELKSINKKYLEGVSGKSPRKYIAASTQFHAKIISIAGNSIIADTIERYALLERIFNLELPKDKLTEHGENPFSHEIIIDILSKRNPDECENIMRNHIQWGKRKVMCLMLNTSLENDIRKAV